MSDDQRPSLSQSRQRYECVPGPFGGSAVWLNDRGTSYPSVSTLSRTYYAANFPIGTVVEAVSALHFTYPEET